jgi:carbamoylphosphate synthase large subunit
MGFESVMVNCNPETVSTDYDSSDQLFFQPLTFEDVMDVVDVVKPVGVIVTLGGQTPINLARRLAEAGVPVMGTQPEAIDLAEDRERSIRCWFVWDRVFHPLGGGNCRRGPLLHVVFLSAHCSGPAMS